VDSEQGGVAKRNPLTRFARNGGLCLRL